MSPVSRIRQNRQAIKYLNASMQRAVINLLTQRKTQLSNAARTLNAISPLQTLERGYSITMTDKGKAIKSIKHVNVDDKIETRLHEGSIISRVETIKDK